MFKDFKAFLQRGNVLDLAVAVIIGGAFRTIVTSLVDDVIMPVLGKLLGNVKFSELKWILEPAQEEMAEVAVYYGMFIQNIINFIIIALTIFVIVRMFENMKRKEEVVEEMVEETTPEDIKLLREIRDSLKNK